MTEHNHQPEEIKQSVVVENGSGGNWTLPVSILIAALIISGSVLYNGNQLMKLLSSGSLNLGVGGNGQAAVGGQQGAGSQAVAPGTPVKITLSDNAPFLGNKNSKVTVVEYADYQCPFCEQWYKNVWPTLKAKYIDTNKIKFVYQDFAFLGPDSTIASEAAHCAQDQGKFWPFHEYLFQNQGQENAGWAKADKQKEFAKTLGLNTSQFNSCLDTHKHTQDVANETNAGKSYGVTGTPTVFVNGKPIVGAQPASVFEQAIEEALK